VINTAKQGVVPAYIHSATVVDIDVERMTCDVVLDLAPRSHFPNCVVAAPYLHSQRGEGVYAFPERGATAWVCIPSEKNSRPFIIGFRPLSDQNGTFRHGRGTMSPGDIFLQAREGNGVRIFRNRDVQIKAGDICSLTLEDLNQVARVHAENVIVETPTSMMALTRARPEQNNNGVSSSQFSLKILEYANEGSYVAELRMGGALTDSMEDDEKPTTVETPVVHLLVRKSEDEEAVPAAQVSFDRTGRMGIELQDVRTVLGADGDVVIFENAEDSAEPMILGRTFLTDLQSSLTEISTALTAIGIPLPNTTTLLSSLSESLTSNSPYLTPRLKVE